MSRLLSRWDNSLAMLIVEAWLRRSTTEALTAGLSTVAADLAPLAFCACVGSCDSFRETVSVGGFGLKLLLLRCCRGGLTGEKRKMSAGHLSAGCEQR